LAAVAITRERAVGIDVERLTDDPPLEVARRMMTYAEVQSLDRLSGRALAERFFALWTLKESYAKALGRGLWLPFQEIEFDSDAISTNFPRLASCVDDDRDRWRFELHRPSDDHCLALAYDAGQLGPAHVRITKLVPRIECKG
jgi:4'-phosphopantetheinyl transferase